MEQLEEIIHPQIGGGERIQQLKDEVNARYNSLDENIRRLATERFDSLNQRILNGELFIEDEERIGRIIDESIKRQLEANEKSRKEELSKIPNIVKDENNRANEERRTKFALRRTNLNDLVSKHQSSKHNGNLKLLNQIVSEMERRGYSYTEGGPEIKQDKNGEWYDTGGWIERGWYKNGKLKIRV